MVEEKTAIQEWIVNQWNIADDPHKPNMIKWNWGFRWKILRPLENCGDTLPPEHCSILGIPQNSTYGQAVQVINKARWKVVSDHMEATVKVSKYDLEDDEDDEDE